MSKTKTLEVAHPKSGEVSEIEVPEDHDGSRVKVEFPDGAIAWTDGWDPAERVRDQPASGDAQPVVDGDSASSRDSA